MLKFTPRKVLLAFLFLVILGAQTSAFAGITVAPLIINFLPNHPPRQDIVIVNQDDKNAYIQITPYLIENPGTDKAKEHRINDPKKLGIIVTPNKVIIPPKQLRRIRISVVQAPGNIDRIYRVVIAPTTGKLTPANTNNSNVQAAIKIIISYGALVIVRPKQPKLEVAVNRNGNIITVANRGNTAFGITKVKQCSDANHCVELPGNRIYAGQIWTVKVPKAAPAELVQSYLGSSKIIHTN